MAAFIPYQLTHNSCGNRIKYFLAKETTASYFLTKTDGNLNIYFESPDTKSRFRRIMLENITISLGPWMKN